ncbi:uncharacterized protein LOC122054865 [Zingiber officinale]|uniref:uncharacterized protein LOC122054865 n=1 Tax=Zingiber officinale TaxID=94328 RepID=UPI001C4D0890|nr:uncharacterized protein LOC122054865 [Zingiber officinale]
MTYFKVIELLNSGETYDILLGWKLVNLSNLGFGIKDLGIIPIPPDFRLIVARIVVPSLLITFAGVDRLSTKLRFSIKHQKISVELRLDVESLDHHTGGTTTARARAPTEERGKKGVNTDSKLVLLSSDVFIGVLEFHIRFFKGEDDFQDMPEGPRTK